MRVALIVGGVILLICGLLAVRGMMQRLRARGRAEIDRRFPNGGVVLSETMAQSFGQQSQGAAQLRGNGALALTADELFFSMHVVSRELHIPLVSIAEVSLVRSHLGKTQGAQLLHVRYTLDGVEDAIAWRVPDAAAWKDRIVALQAARP